MASDLDFAVGFARLAGRQMYDMRRSAQVSRKLDRTAVTDADKAINAAFIQEVHRRSGGRASVRGEEASSLQGFDEVWTIDPIDGTGEYIDPSLEDSQRTSCVGTSLFRQGRLVLSVVFNPFRQELFTAEAEGAALLNGSPIVCAWTQLGYGTRYDYSYWDGARYDARGLEQTLGEPLGVYSAIYQACMVAAGQSAFAVFPGDTIHDIAPGALLVARAGGQVTDLRGRPLQWGDLSQGVLYSSPVSHSDAVRLVRSL